MSAWQDISKAPRDGTKVDGWAINTITGKPVGRFTNMWWEGDCWQYGNEKGFYWDIEAPIAAATGEPVVKLTHFMEIPAPPLPGESNARFIAGPATPSKR